MGRISAFTLAQKPQWPTIFAHQCTKESCVSEVLKVILKTSEKCTSVATGLTANEASAYLEAKFSSALHTAAILALLSLHSDHDQVTHGFLVQMCPAFFKIT